jgi:DNA-binding MarR family transcriptional regulator
MAKRPTVPARLNDALTFPLAESLGNQIRLTSRLFDRAIANRLKASGIPYGTWGFLRLLWQKDGQTQMELASAMDLSPPTAVAAIDTMEKLELIRRERSVKDRRNVHVQLTRKGKALEAQLLPFAIEVNDLAVANIRHADLERFSEILQAMQESLRADDEKFSRDSQRKRLRMKLRTIE